MNKSSGFREILGHVKIKFSVAEIVGGKASFQCSGSCQAVTVFKEIPTFGKD